MRAPRRRRLERASEVGVVARQALKPEEIQSETAFEFGIAVEKILYRAISCSRPAAFSDYAPRPRRARSGLPQALGRSCQPESNVDSYR